MKILLYNWTPLYLNIGGGVRVYLQNFIDSLVMQNKLNIQIYFLSSGFFYDNSHITHIRKEELPIDINIYSIVNSPIVAPLEYSSCEISRVYKDNTLYNIFYSFIKENGPFDVIHFESIEGISTNVFKLKEIFPKTKFYHSIHDYGFICPNVKLWNNNENCLFSERKFKCKECLNNSLVYSTKDIIHRLPSNYSDVNIKKHFTFLMKRKHEFKRFFKIGYPGNDEFNKYRQNNIQMINKYCDGELCVSKRVADIAIEAGITKNKVLVDYIGTKAANNVLNRCRTNPDSSAFTILYMGYECIEKGFYLYLHALEIMGDESKNIILKFASKIKNIETKNRLTELKTKFKDVVIYDGYTHNDFPVIMEDVNLGIVPPLWEDNLPQVAIEMISNGIPVLTSMNGGAKELNSHVMFRFQTEKDLLEKIKEINSKRYLLTEYWNYAHKLTSMDTHIENLIKIYNKS